MHCKYLDLFFTTLLNQFILRMGTSCPALYHVLHDENGFSSDDIQQLTYWVCISIIYESDINIDF